MSALQALSGFTAWTVLLITAVFLYRGVKFLGGTPINHWPRQAKSTDDVALVKRLDVVAPYAAIVLYARVAQSTVHLIG